MLQDWHKQIYQVKVIFANTVKKKKIFDDKLKSLNKGVTSNKSKHVLVENELKIIADIWLNSFNW